MPVHSFGGCSMRLGLNASIGPALAPFHGDTSRVDTVSFSFFILQHTVLLLSNCRRLAATAIGCPPTAFRHPPTAVGHLTTARFPVAEARVLFPPPPLLRLATIVDTSAGRHSVMCVDTWWILPCLEHSV